MLLAQIKKIINNKTFANVAVVAVITVFVKFLGFYKEIKIAEEFGLSELLDTFYIALLIPGLINQVFLISFKSVFIPNYIAELKEKNEAASFQSVSFFVTITLGILFTIVSFLVTDTYLDIFFGGHTEEYYRLVKIQFYYLSPCLIIWGLNALLSGILNIFDEFKHSSIYPVLTSIIMLACLFGFKDLLEEKVLAVGMLLGSLAELLFLLVVCFKRNIIKIVKPDFESKNTKLMLKEFPARIASSLLSGLIPITDQYFAAKLAVGSIAALNYGYKVPAFISTISIVALGNVLLPYFSSLLIENKAFAYDRLYYILKLVFGGVLLAVIPLAIASHFITELIYERGAFTTSDTDIVSSIQIVYFAALPFSICTDVIVRFITSINKNRFLAYLSAINLVLNVILNYIFIKIYGVIGVAICTTIIQITNAIILYRFSVKTKKMMLA